MSKAHHVIEVIVQEQRRYGKFKENMAEDEQFTKTNVRCAASNKAGSACGRRVSVFVDSAGETDFPLCGKHSFLTPEQLKGLKLIEKEYRERERILRRNNW